MPEWLPAVLIAAIAALPGMAALFAQRGKNNADAAASITGAAKVIIDELQEQSRENKENLLQVTAELYETRRELAETKEELRKLTSTQLDQSILISTMRDTIAQLQMENVSLKERIKELTAENELFRNELEKLGHKPDTGQLKRKR